MDLLCLCFDPEDLQNLDLSLQLKLRKHPTMQMPRTCIVFICLCGTVLPGQSLNSLQDMDAYLETSSETHEIGTADVHPPGIDRGVTSVSRATLSAGKTMFLSLKCCLVMSA